MYKFDDNYNNLEQVKPFYQEFKKLFDEIDGTKYNSMFEGKIAGIAGEDEKTAIYLLQQLEQELSKQKIIEQALKDGYNYPKYEGKRTIKYAHILQIGTDYSKNDKKEFENANLLFTDTGKLEAILPARCSRKGYYIYPDRIILVK